MEPHPEFDLAFSSAGRVRLTQYKDKYPLLQHHIGDLMITSGKLIATNPFYETVDEPFDFTVAPGSYPVIVTMVPSYRDRRPEILFTRVQFAPEKPVLWELTLRHSQYDFGRFDVDLYAGCVMDAAAFPYVMMTLEVEGYEALEDGLENNRAKQKPWLEYYPHPRRPLNVFLFSASFMEDDDTESYQGFDEAGNCVCLLTHYNIADFEETEK